MKEIDDETPLQTPIAANITTPAGNLASPQLSTCLQLSTPLFTIGELESIILNRTYCDTSEVANA
jgi:hypothetical protein